MKICLRFHMSKIFESGWAEKILTLLKKYGDVIAITSGTITTISMMDFGLKGIKILKERFVNWINKENFDLIISATHASSLERMLADCWHLYKKINLPIIGIEVNNKVVAYWKNVKKIAEEISNDLNFKLMEGIDYGETFWIENEIEYRKILAVEPGDWILVNGIIIGKVIEKDLIFVCKNGKILDIRGGIIKENGIKKLEKIDLRSAKIDTIKILRDEVKNRASLEYISKEKIAFINHTGYDILRILDEGICCAVTVGDDTTTIVGDILERFNIPIIGIVDEDKDGLIKGAKFHPNSIILKVENDDDFGNIIYKKIFNEKQIIEGNFEWIKNKILELYGAPTGI
ncbi:MAG: DUF2117 domain-containing protein [Candidatus Methanomethylicaceae archaeon]